MTRALTDVEDELRGALSAEARRAQPGMLRPLRDPAPHRFHRPGTLRWPTVAAGGGHGVRGWLAPAASVVAVVALLAGVFAAGGLITANRQGAGAPAGGMPRFYVDIEGTPGHVSAVVRDSRTGARLSSLPVPTVPGPPPWIAAASDRSYAIAVAARPSNVETRFLLLHVSANGRAAKLSTLPVKPVSGGPLVTGLALSADGKYLAIALSTGSLPRNRGAVEVASTSTGAARTWSSHGQSGFPFDPSFADQGRRLGFGWYNHFSGHFPDIYSKAEVRLLDLSAPSRELLAAKVIVGERKALGTVQTAMVSADGHSVIATVTRDISRGGYHGTIVARLARISAATGRQAAVYRTVNVPYHSNNGRYLADGACQVLSLDATGRHALVHCTHLGRVDDGVFTPLPGNLANSELPAAAW